MHTVSTLSGAGIGHKADNQGGEGAMPQGLGEFEQMVLLAILHVKDEAYGVPIVEEIERRTGRTVSRAAVYVTLRRLEQRGLVTSWMSEPTGERGGKARRCVRVEAEGLAQLRDTRQAMDRMWGELDPTAVGGDA